MTFSIIAVFALPAALHAANPVEAPPVAKPSSFADLSLEEATAARCGTAFAIVQGWQESGDQRGGAWPRMKEAQARAFFLRAMARLIDRYDLARSDVTRLVDAETERHLGDNFASVQAMMPACLALLDTITSTGE